MTKPTTLEEVAQAMVAPGKGILAADESSGTIKKRFDAIKAESTADTRRDYREMMFRCTEAMKSHISGVILYDETIRQKAKDGTPLPKVIEAAGALPGIKVDAGTKPLPFCPGEVITEGLDGLRDRIKDYVGLGAKFAKWRAVIDIGRNMPSYNCINANAQALARYAALCVEGGLVPIVEPEVLMDGDHDIDACEKVTEWMLKETYAQLYYAKVPLEQTILKPNMVIAGKKCAKQASRQEVAERTVKVLKRVRAGGRAGHRLPLRRPVRRGRHGAPVADEPAGAVAVEAVVLLRPGVAGRVPEGLGRQAGKRGGRTARLLPSGQDERRRHARQMERAAGEGGLDAHLSSRPRAPAREPGPRATYALSTLGPGYFATRNSGMTTRSLFRPNAA